VGWFTALFPVLLSMPSGADPGSALKSIKEQLRQIPNRGIGYGALRYLSQDSRITEGLRTLPQPEVVFNYLSQTHSVAGTDSLLALESTSLRGAQSTRASRSHLLIVNGQIAEDRLNLTWSYSSSLHRVETIERLSTGFMEALRSLIAHCKSPRAGGFTPSDFPQAKVSQRDLDSLLSKLKKSS